ncbi:MAG: ATP-binding protein [Pseudomonadota bacterium]|nr:ATP-binding protein [Pseudomonadota bacterium]
MTPSIRTFLLINLLLSITLITSLAIIGNLFLEHKDLQRHLNAQLTFAALTIQSFVGETENEKDIAKIQSKIDRLPEIAKEYYRKTHRKMFGRTYELIQFQIWNKDGRLLLRSHSAPEVPLSKNISGFSTNWVEGQLWHVFTNIDVETGLRIDVGERSDFREELEGRVTQDSIFIMLITYPFLGILIWIIVGRGLDSIRQVANEVRRRTPNALEPVNIEAVPSEIKPLIDELNKLFIRLGDAFEREKRFAADAAHELRTPLAALKTQAQVAINIKDPEELRTALDKILSGVDRSSHVVGQLLTMSRMVPQATLQQFDDVDIVTEARTVIAELVPIAIEKEIDIELSAPEAPVTLHGNLAAISILIRNLVDNAIRYCPNQSEINISIHATANHVILRVADNGPGIPVELRERVFERFFRVLGTKAHGSGLGLGIVAQIVELHKAEIKLDEPEQGSGLVVTVIFPLRIST